MLLPPLMPLRLAAAQALLLVAQLLTVDGLAAEFSKVLGKPVRALPLLLNGKPLLRKAPRSTSCWLQPSPEALAGQETGKQVAVCASPQVTYEATTPDAWRDMTVRLWGAHTTDDALVHLRALWGIVRLRSADPALVQEIAHAVPDLERVLGHEPLLLGAWLGPYLKSFAG